MKAAKKICALLLVLLLLFAVVPTGFAATKTATADEATIKSDAQAVNANKGLTETGADIKTAQTGGYFKTEVGKTYYTAVHGAVTGKITSDSYWYDLNSNPIKFKQNASPFYAGEPLTVVRLSKTDPTTNSKYSFAATTDAYCIQPGTELGAVGVKATNTGKSAYANFSANLKNAVGLALYYGLPGQGKSSSCSNETVQQAATQVVLWELIKNYRSSSIDKSKSGDGNFVRSNAALYNGVVSSYNELKNEYNDIVTGLQRHYKIPSFMRFAENKAQTITLAYDSTTNKYTAKVKDSNWVLYDKNGHSTVSFTNKDGVTFKKDGYYLTITSTKPIDKAITITATKTFNAPKQNGTLVTFDPTGGQQDVISGVATTPAKITAYMRIKTDNAVGSLELNKSSSNPQLTDGNSCYSLCGAEYEIYDENGNLIDTIVTDDEGMGHITGLKIGKYTVRETKASKGYAVDVNTHEVTIEAGKTAVLNVKEMPQNDPINVVLSKCDSETRRGLSGAEFTIKYYKDFYKTEEELQGVLPERQWVLSTDEDGDSFLDKSYLVSGDEFYYATNSGNPAFPLGTITIQETKAPDGYVIDDTLFIRQITSDGSAESVFTYNAPEIPNAPQKSGVKIVKTSEDGKIDNIYFNVKTAAQDIGNFATNDKGELNIDDLNVYDDNGQLIEYTVTELGDKQTDGTYKLNNKYQELKSKTVTLSYDEITTVSFKNRLKKGGVTLYKQNQNGDGITGAKFALYKADGTQMSAIQNGAGSYIASQSTEPVELSTNDNGVLSVSQLPQGEYYFIETKSPDGYMIYDKKIPFTVSAEENDDTLNAEITVRNNKVLLFNTGNSGNTVYFVIAGLAALSSLALFAALLIKKRKDKKNMKKVSTLVLSLALALITVFSIATPKFAAETAPLDTAQKVSFTVNCDKKGYIFEVYKVGSLVQTTSPYEVKYESLVPEISDSILNGDTASMLKALDETTKIPTAAVGSFNSTTENRKTFSDLTQGIYYVRAVSYPAGVKSVTNSVFALPYYSNGWQYTIDEINLAQKVNDDVPEIVKTITNSTKNNVNYTDVSLGETVNFEIKSTTAGSNQIKLKEYVITDDMSKGLTLDKTSFDVTLQDQYGKDLNKLTKDDYVVKIDSEAEGQNTVFTVSVTNEYLQKSDFYNALYVSVKYSAALNKYAVTGFDGNPNTVKNLKYTNKFDVSAEIEGNTVYVYTYGVLLNKYNEVGQKLSGAEFALYKNEADAKDEKNAIASGTSDNDGKTVFKTSENEEIKLQSGTYYIKETKAPDGYNKYTDVIPVTITAEYGNEFVNNTYLTSAPENGIATVEVKNSKTLLPQTGGNALFILYVVAGVTGVTALALFAVLLIRRKKAIDEK